MFEEEKENGEAEEPEAAAEDAAEPEEKADDKSEAKTDDESEAKTDAKTDADDAPADADGDEPEADAGDASDEGDAAAEEAQPASPTKPTRKKRTPEEKAERRARRKRRRIAARPDERKPIVRIPKPEQPRAARKERVGVVVSDAMNCTITVRVERAFPHPRYGKVIRRSTTFAVHDAENEAGVGDRVRIVETRPLSKTKRWRLAEIVEAAR